MALLIPSDVAINGHIRAQGDVRLRGRLHGTLHALGLVHIEAGASCQAAIHARRVVVLGEVIGNIRGLEAIELLPGARVVGDVFSPDVAIGAGVELEGRVGIVEPADAVAADDGDDGDSVPVRRQRRIPKPPRLRGRVTLVSG